MNKAIFLSAKELLLPENMIFMYSKGAFPMADENGEINWYLPEVRTIIPLDDYNIPRSTKKIINKFEYRYDTDTLSVIERCAERESTWISDELIKSYKELIKLGYLHSVESFLDNQLVGGLYGITFKGAFFGESMFSKVTQASKCTLVKLIERLVLKDFTILDVQYQTDHLKMFGAKEISFDQFTLLLQESYKKSPSFI